MDTLDVMSAESQIAQGVVAESSERHGASWRLVCADWLDASADLEAESIDLLYLDPPFMTQQRQSDQGGAFDDRWEDRDAYLQWMRRRLEATLRAMRPTGSILLHCDWRMCHHLRLLLDGLLGEAHFVNHLIWRYGLGGSSPRRFARKHDDILFYAIDPARYWFEPPMVPATSRRMAGELKKATDVLDVPSINNQARERVGWPTQKPLALLEILVGACCPPGGAVLDPCCGSGTTLIAAQRLVRHAIGIDKSAEALALAKRRLVESEVEGAKERAR